MNSPAAVLPNGAVFGAYTPDRLGAMLGDSADRLIANDFDPGALRPYKGPDGRSYMTRNIYNPRTARFEEVVMTCNAPATLTVDAWKSFDDAIVRAIRTKLRAFSDIRARGLEYNLPNGMAHTMLQWQTLGDMTPATISMDPIRRSEGDRPVTNTGVFPLPIIHKDFDFSAREILTSRQGNIPIDTTTAENAGRVVAEAIEQLTVGTASFSYGGGTIYGYTNFPQRATKNNMPVPTGSNNDAVVTAILALRQLLINNRHTGPYMFYVNTQWSAVLDTDYSTVKGTNTLRERILSISGDNGIVGIATLDTLPTVNWDCLLVEMDTQTVRAVVGMEIQTVQWESMGGLMKHFKVMALLLPQLRPDTASNSGIAHGTTA